MGKSLAFGNGTTLVTTDKFAQVRDLYFPYVGLENHIGGEHAHKIGVWVENQFAWTDDGTWNVDTRADGAYTGITTLRSNRLDVELQFTDALSNDHDIFLRSIKVHNRAAREREIRVFFNHQYEIYHSENLDTAFYDPMTNTVIHYEGRRAFLMNLRHEGRGIDDYTVGIFQIEGKEGTYRDAEDGVLAKNPIEHGQVDSTVGVKLIITAQGVALFHYWLTVGDSIEEAKKLNQLVLDRSPEVLIRSARDYWYAWVEKNNWNFYGLGDTLIDLFKKSQFYLRSHVDKHGGVIASGDSDILQGARDTYAYVWPRDSAYVATALDWIGDRHSARQFFLFCNKAITPEGYLMHKYRADGSLGSSWHGWVVNGVTELPIQEDETALILWALWEHWLASKDLDFIESIYESFIVKAADFLVQHRDKTTGLPKPSYNLWEERFGVHTYTVSTVYAGLKAAARFAEMLGKEQHKENFSTIAEEIKEALLKYLYSPEDGNFARALSIDQQGVITYDRTIDSSSAYGVFLFEVLPPEDERLMKSMKLSKERLTVHTPVGGIARYEGDNYFRVGDGPGNPWFITTMWYTQYAIALAKNDHDLDLVRAELNWVEHNALHSGVLSEQLNPFTGGQLSAAPLTWSHAEYIRTIVMYMKRLGELGITVIPHI